MKISVFRFSPKPIFFDKICVESGNVENINIFAQIKMVKISLNGVCLSSLFINLTISLQMNNKEIIAKIN